MGKDKRGNCNNISGRDVPAERIGRNRRRQRVATEAKAQEEYIEVNRKVKKSTKRDKRNFIDSLAKESEEATAKGNMKRAPKKLSPKISQPE